MFLVIGRCHFRSVCCRVSRRFIMNQFPPRLLAERVRHVHTPVAVRPPSKLGDQLRIAGKSSPAGPAPSGQHQPHLPFLLSAFTKHRKSRGKRKRSKISPGIGNRTVTSRSHESSGFSSGVLCIYALEHLIIYTYIGIYVHTQVIFFTCNQKKYSVWIKPKMEPSYGE